MTAEAEPTRLLLGWQGSVRVMKASRLVFPPSLIGKLSVSACCLQRMGRNLAGPEL